MTTSEEFTPGSAAAALRKHVRLLAVLAGVTASAAVTIPQLLPRKVGFGSDGLDAMAVFLGFSFATFMIGVATPIYAYARSVKLGQRMPAAAFAPLALLVAAALGMLIIGTIRRQTRDVQFTPKAQPPAGPVQPRR